MKKTGTRILRGIGVALALLLVGATATYPIVDLARPALDDSARAQLLASGDAEQFVSTSLGVMHVRVSGPESGPVVLLVHGGAVGGYGFQNWQRPLADAGYRVVLPDLLGYGYSERPAVPYTREFYTTQLHELLEGLGVDGPVNVIGASLGGTIATAFAAEYPDSVVALALMAPAGGGRTDIAPPALTLPIFGDWMFRVVGPSTVQRQIEGAYVDTPARDDMSAWMIAQGTYRGFGEGILNTIRSYDSTWQPETNQAVGETDIPVFAAWGTDDVVNPYAQSDQIRKWIPQLELFTLDGIGHAITYGQADRVLAEVLPFLAAANAEGR